MSLRGNSGRGCGRGGFSSRGSLRGRGFGRNSFGAVRNLDQDFFDYPIEEDLVCYSEICEDLPFFNASADLETKKQIDEVDEISDQALLIDPVKLLPFQSGQKKRGRGGSRGSGRGARGSVRGGVFYRGGGLGSRGAKRGVGLEGRGGNSGGRGRGAFRGGM